MSDFSPSGLYGMPQMTMDSLLGGDPRVLGWLQEAVQEGDLLNRDDPAYDLAEKGIRDSLSIRPSTNPNPQLWQGVVFRAAQSITAMRAKYPGREGLFRPAPDNLLTTVMSKFRRAVPRIMSPAGDTLSGLAGVPAARPVRPGDIVLYRCYLNDRSKNLTSKPLVMGDPSANWSYIVDPGGLLYPQK